MSSSSKKPRKTRELRQKPEKLYIDSLDSDCEDETIHYSILQDRLASTKFPRYIKYFVKRLSGTELTVDYFQRSGFNIPLHIPGDNTGMGMRVPDSNFSVSDVRAYVGARRVLDVMDTRTQKNSLMTMKEWEKYYMGDQEQRAGKLLNVISLEFSCTKMDPLVIAPLVVRQLCWTDNVWPKHLKEMQTVGTNDMDQMKFPKVQKYCLMSVAGCFTDFHIDFGGTSVWYHVLRGKKVFWLIPPTEANLKIYQTWTTTGKQGDEFFGDLVEKCGMITLDRGDTFFIPSGWIHAVYTPSDSLVFGGNFLHSYAIEKQIRVAQIEEASKVPAKFRFPFFTELHWYALDRYSTALLDRSHLSVGNDGDNKSRAAVRSLTAQELFGLKTIIMYLHALPITKKHIPSLIRDPSGLISDVQSIIADSDKYLKRFHSPVISCQERVPCKICQSCILPNCGRCHDCLDGRRCHNRRCLQPLLKSELICAICGLDGWHAEPSTKLSSRCSQTCCLYECSICHEVSHPTCFTDYGVNACLKLDQPNWWQCPKCAKVDSTDDKNQEIINYGPDAKIVGFQLFSVQTKSNVPKPVLRRQLADQLMAASTSETKKPTYVVRPPPPPLQTAQSIYDRQVHHLDLALEQLILILIFQWLPNPFLASTCALVCRTWHDAVQDPSLWNRTLSLRQCRLTPDLLSLLVRRQPLRLSLAFGKAISRHQLQWLLARLPQLRGLSLSGLDWTTTVSGLCTVNGSMLRELDLSYVSNFNDGALFKLLISPPDTRPGLLDKKSRLKLLQNLDLSGTEISDISMRYVVQYLGHLTSLSVSSCWKLTDAALGQLACPPTTTHSSDNSSGASHTLRNLDLSGCSGITNYGLNNHISKCDNLIWINFDRTSITKDELLCFSTKRRYKLHKGMIITFNQKTSLS